LIEVFLQATSTTTAITSGQSDTSALAIIALILGIISTALSIPLAILKIKEYHERGSNAALKLLAPKLRDIRVLMKQLRFVEADRLYHREIHGKGLEPMLMKISPPVGPSDPDLPRLFFRLSFVSDAFESETIGDPLRDREAKTARLEELAGVARRIVAQIDKILEKAEGV
jgi:hypothetical protein